MQGQLFSAILEKIRQHIAGMNRLQSITDQKKDEDDNSKKIKIRQFFNKWKVIVRFTNDWWRCTLRIAVFVPKHPSLFRSHNPQSIICEKDFQFLSGLEVTVKCGLYSVYVMIVIVDLNGV